MNSVPGRYNGCTEFMLMLLPSISGQLRVTDCRKARNGSIIRDESSSRATTAYGSHALKMVIEPLWWATSVTSTEPVHSPGQVSLRSKSQASCGFGTRKPARAANTTMIRPTMLPVSDGNSGPKKYPASRYGMVIARAENRANGHTCRPSAMVRLRPKNRVMNATRISGMSVPAIAWRIATFRPMAARNVVHSPHWASVSGLAQPAT